MCTNRTASDIKAVDPSVSGKRRERRQVESRACGKEEYGGSSSKAYSTEADGGVAAIYQELRGHAISDQEISAVLRADIEEEQILG